MSAVLDIYKAWGVQCTLLCGYATLAVLIIGGYFALLYPRGGPRVSKFDGIDLGSDKTMRRMVAAEVRKRNEIIEQCAIAAARVSLKAAKAVRELKTLD